MVNNKINFMEEDMVIDITGKLDMFEDCDLVKIKGKKLLNETIENIENSG